MCANTPKRHGWSVGWLIPVIAMFVGCSPKDILSVPPPSNILAGSALQNKAGGEGVFNSARSNMFTTVAQGVAGLIDMVGQLSDEFTAGAAGKAEIDSRHTVYPGESEDGVISNLLAARNSLLIGEGLLQQYETGSARSEIGEAYALVGYTELLMAEDYCAGVPLTQTTTAGFTYGTPLTTDSLLATAERHFDSARVYANNNDTIQALAQVGLGRTLLDRDRLDSAAQAVAGVPSSFVYAMWSAGSYSPYEGSLNLYADATSSCSDFTVSDKEGKNGLNFVSAQDPRLATATLGETCDGFYNQLPDSVFTYPLKFGNPSTDIPLATGIEAALIQAEAALADGDAATWLADLNMLRNGNSNCTDLTNASCPLGTGQVPGQVTGLYSLADPGSDTARIRLTFRERAFWLFGTGTRLGDLRRLVRQYAPQYPVFVADSVYPIGPYAAALQGNAAWQHLLSIPIVQYGNDVNITLPTTAAGNGAPTANPAYKGGCLTSTTTA